MFSGDQHYPAVCSGEEQAAAMPPCQEACSGVMETAGGNHPHCLPPGSHPGWGQAADYPGSVAGCAWQGSVLLEISPLIELHCCIVLCESAANLIVIQKCFVCI